MTPCVPCQGATQPLHCPHTPPAPWVQARSESQSQKKEVAKKWLPWGLLPQIAAQPSSYLFGDSKTTHRKTTHYQPALLTSNLASCQWWEFPWWLSAEIKRCHFSLVKWPKEVLPTLSLALPQRFPPKPWTRIVFRQHPSLDTHFHCPAAAAGKMGGQILL